MNDQIKSAVEIIIKPKSTLAKLPSDSLYVLGLLTPLYFGFSRVVQNGRIEKMLGSAPTNKYIIAYLATLVMALIVIILWAIVVKGIIALFRKNLSVFKILNLWGYSQVPRLLLVIPSIVVFVFLSDEIKARLFSDSSLVFWIIFSTLGILLMLYSLFLFIFGIVVSKSE